MPTLDDLNEIKSNLLSLGDEPGILAAKGETPVDIGPPETGLSDDINALFDDFADVEEEPESSVPELAEGVEGFEDFNLDLDDEPAFDMDGFDAPEPDSSVPELAEGDMDGFDAPDSPVPELAEGPVPEQFDEPLAEDDLAFNDFGDETSAEELSFNDLEDDAPDSADITETDLAFDALGECDCGNKKYYSV